MGTICVHCWTRIEMPRYYCDYCDTYLTHDSAAVRKQHNSGYKHKANVRNYYMQFDDLHPSLALPPPANQMPGGLPPHLATAQAPLTANGQNPMPLTGFQQFQQQQQQIGVNLPRPPFQFPPGILQPGQIPPAFSFPPINPNPQAATFPPGAQSTAPGFAPQKTE